MRYLVLILLLLCLNLFSIDAYSEEAAAVDDTEAETPDVKEFGAGDVGSIVVIDGAEAAVVAFSELGAVDLMTVSYSSSNMEDNSTADNTTGRLVLVNGAPAAIPVEKTAAAKINIKNDPKYSKFTSVNPNVVLSTKGVEFEKVQTLTDVLRYNFLFIVRDGGDDGSPVGYARIAFDFDKNGNFLKTVLIKLMKTRQPL